MGYCGNDGKLKNKLPQYDLRIRIRIRGSPTVNDVLDIKDKPLTMSVPATIENMSDTFSLLWSKILRSSLWVRESKETRLVWVTMMALKDKEGKVQSSVVGLADAAKVSLEECREALIVLSAPDPEDTSKVDEGRRIRAIPGGWELTNHALYQFSTEEKREYWRRKKAAERQRKQDKARETRGEQIIKEVTDGVAPGTYQR